MIISNSTIHYLFVEKKFFSNNKLFKMELIIIQLIISIFAIN